MVEDLGITQRLLEVCERHAQPVSIITKSALVLRDTDILARMAARGLCHVMVSVTTLDDGLKRRLEPRTASGAARLRAVRALADAGVPTQARARPRGSCCVCRGRCASCSASGCNAITPSERSM